MKIENKRLCIYPKDIQRITGKSYRQSVRLMLKIRTDLNKQVNEFVSIAEFCQYTSSKYSLLKKVSIPSYQPPKSKYSKTTCCFPECKIGTTALLSILIPMIRDN